MLEIIFVVVLFVIVFGATGFGLWYEIFGPDEDYVSAEAVRDQENAAPRQVINAQQMMEEAQAEEVNEEQEQAPI